MALQVGIRLDPYEIQAPIGAGGMGEVYRAKDTRLDRTVAIKIIPSHLSNNSDLKQRFEREARTISSLNHPNICALYDIGNQNGIDFLVMEFLDGETLAERLNKGSLPLDQVFRYGIQIVDALDKAHKQGIIHRDLKPGNIMLTKSGIKLLDFGLAKLHAVAPQPLLSGVSALPTEHHDLTAEGTILGTIQYMSPEQLEAKETDVRTDIFALGAVLYEMATGKKAFSGRSQASLIAAILSSDPAPVSTIQPISPPAFDRIVKTCLSKDPDDRWQTAHDVMLELKWVADERTSGRTSTTFQRIHKWRERVAWGATCIFFITTLILLILHFRNNVPQQGVYRLSINPPENFSFSSSLALSPNGQHLAFTVMDPDGTSSLWIRKLDSLSSQRLPGTDDAVFPFWSPDGNSLGFFADGKLKRIEIAGGPSIILADATNDPRGGTWNRSDEILFSPGFQAPIYRISASGGNVTQVTTLNKERLEASHRWPLFLPDGQHFLYLMLGGKGGTGSIYIGSLQGENPKLLMKVNSVAAFAPPENLLFVREQTLMVQRFDPKTFALKGSAAPIAEQLAIHPDMAGFAAFSVSDNGVLAYRSESNISQLILVDRSNRILKEVGAPGYYFAQSLSPDSTRVAVTIQDLQTHNGDIWIFNLIRGVPTRVTFDPADDQTPFWSPDGKQIVFGSDRAGGTMNLFLQNADSTKSEKLLLRSDVLNHQVIGPQTDDSFFITDSIL